MKRLFSLLALFACMTATYAQGTLVATLNHNDTVSFYYGSSALIDAHSAAVDGDVITLSPGIFVATDITKIITLRGAGMQEDSLLGCKPTTITGDFRISFANSSAHKLYIEGIYHAGTITYDCTIKNASFVKSLLHSIRPQGNNGNNLINVNFLHCKIMQSIVLTGHSNNASLINCVVEDPSCSGTSSFTFMNCVIKYEGEYQESVVNSHYESCIIYQRIQQDPFHVDFRGRIPASCTAYNCVAPDQQYELFSNINNSTNKYTTSAELFKTYRGQALAKLEDETFELTDSAKVAFFGTDGTQVGIYGGALPFELTATIPQIKKFDVAPKSTADGKLQVDIEVSAAVEEPEL